MKLTASGQLFSYSHLPVIQWLNISWWSNGICTAKKNTISRFWRNTQHSVVYLEYIEYDEQLTFLSTSEHEQWLVYSCTAVQCSECTTVQTSRSNDLLMIIILPQYGPDYQAGRFYSYIVLCVIIQCLQCIVRLDMMWNYQMKLFLADVSWSLK